MGGERRLDGRVVRCSDDEGYGEGHAASNAGSVAPQPIRPQPVTARRS
ncbi:hypothetical protein GZL_08172 [Streptomyces sp. 769]|nr:hypothetical protein GZL_08172 [Streptomyces sp. 769]